MEIRVLRYFLETAREGNITRAARNYCRTVSETFRFMKKEKRK